MKLNYITAAMCFCLMVVSFSARSQATSEETLVVADSLFRSQKYTESFELYDSLLNYSRVSSPSMLLKMAFIKEGLGDYSNAEYYLNLYYLRTSDRKALTKMEELASSNALNGYDFNDWEWVKTIFFKYFDYLSYFLLALAIMLLAIMYYQKFKVNDLSVAPGIFLVIVLDYDRFVIVTSEIERVEK
ncbi:MAG: hypothetical protein AAFN93_06605 [Bacteroidota bacterium]